MIAKTFAGNNLLGLGLISHFTAVIIAMIPFQEVGSLIIYLIGSLLLSLAVFIEFFNQQENVLKNWHFYTTSILSLFVIIGPIFVCWILYTLSEDKNKHPKSASHFITSFFALNVHPLALLIWSISIVVITLAILVQQHDRYFYYISQNIG